MSIERLPTEPAEHFAWLEFYRDLGPGRTLAAAWRLFAGRPTDMEAPPVWREAARRWDWDSRCQQHDQQAGHHAAETTPAVADPVAMTVTTPYLDATAELRRLRSRVEQRLGVMSALYLKVARHMEQQQLVDGPLRPAEAAALLRSLAAMADSMASTEALLNGIQARTEGR